MGSTVYISNGTDSKLGEAINALQNSLSNTDCRIDLTSNQVQRLTDALIEIDQRTSGMVVLPDGQTRYVGLIGGFPRIIDSHLFTGTELYNQGDYANALMHFTNAIAISKQMESIIEEGRKTHTLTLIASSYSPPFVSQFYCDAAFCYIASGGDASLAYENAKKAFDLTNSVDNILAFAVAAYNFNKHAEATNSFAQLPQSVVDADPNWQKLKRILDSGTPSFIQYITHFAPPPANDTVPRR